MSLQSRTSQFNENATNIPQQLHTSLPIIAPSPLMFEDDIISDGIQSQLDVSHSINRVISTGKSQEPSQWTLNLKTPSIGGTGCTTSRSHQMFLSISSIERVSICGLCDYVTNLNEMNDHHNRTVTDITDVGQTEVDLDVGFARSVFGSFTKRAKLNQPSGMAPEPLLTAEAFDVLGKLAKSTKAINNHLVSLHEDCGKHLTMVNHIIGAMDT